jgi:hypothetical protein
LRHSFKNQLTAIIFVKFNRFVTNNTQKRVKITARTQITADSRSMIFTIFICFNQASPGFAIDTHAGHRRVVAVCGGIVILFEPGVVAFGALRIRPFCSPGFGTGFWLVD